MPPQGSTVPASSESIGAFLSLDEDGQKTLLSKLSPSAKESLLMGLRTLSQAKEYGTTTGAGYKLPGETSERRYPTISKERGGGQGPFEELAFQGVPEAARALYPGGKWLGAAALTMAAPEAGVVTSGALAALGGAAGESAEELAGRAYGSEGLPGTSRQAAGRIAKAGTTTGATELGFRTLTDAVPYLYRAYLRHTDPFESGIDLLFRGINPPKSMPEFRENLIEAADDLVNVYNRVDKRLASPQVKGGVINPDMRFREFQKSLDQYMKEMYQAERAGQIRAGVNYGSRVTVQGNPNELEFIGRWLSRQLPVDSPALAAAQSLASNPLRPIPIADADELARVINSYDLKSAWEGAASRVLSGKRALDQGLKTGLNTELQRIGQPGISSYERRYAALAQIRDQIESEMTPAEKRLWTQRLHSFLSLHGLNIRTHLGVFESPGSMLEEGLQRLRKSGAGGPGGSTARPQRIYQAYPVTPGTGIQPVQRGYPQAGPPPPGAGGGTGAQPFVLGRPQQPKGMLPPPSVERRGPGGGGGPPAGTAERRTIPFEGIQGPNPMRAALIRDVQNKINLLPKDDPVRKVLQDRLDDMKAHPFEQAEEGLDINKIRAAQEKKPSGKPRGTMTPPPKKEDFDF